MNLKKNENISIILVTLISLAIFYSLFLIYPIIHQFIGSFFDWNPLIEKFNFVGLKNYIRVFNDKIFWKSLLNTIFFTIVVLFSRTILGLVIAVLINNIKHLKAFFRTAYFIPVITSMVAVSLVWKWMYD
ncbi:MAG: sugar ABC transporter permease, partial [Actinomycetota bacterium]|nr:sugar ABC transporter permease [Actinomycetota bacterium]